MENTSFLHSYQSFFMFLSINNFQSLSLLSEYMFLFSHLSDSSLSTHTMGQDKSWSQTEKRAA
jgi:hypothetical protein